MAGRGSDSDPKWPCAGEPESSSPPPRPVVSLSPDRAVAPDAPGDAVGESPTTPSGGFAFRGSETVDKRAFDELAGTLRSLVDEAQRGVRRLEARVAEAERPGRASTELQERLRLGARMLRAFEDQIDRVGATIEALDERRAATDAATAGLDETLARIEASAAEILDRANRQLQDIADAAITRLERQITRKLGGLPSVEEVNDTIESSTRAAVERIESHAEEWNARLESVAHRLAQIEPRVGELAQAVETAEVAVAAATHRVAKGGRDAETRAAAMIDRLEQAVTEAERVAAIEGCLARWAEGIEETVVRMAPTDALCSRLESLLERLAPWERLLLDSACDPDGSPRPVSSMLEDLRRGLGEDLPRLAGTMRGLARCVDDLALPPGRDEGAVVTKIEGGRALKLRNQ